MTTQQQYTPCKPEEWIAFSHASKPSLRGVASRRAARNTLADTLPFIFVTMFALFQPSAMVGALVGCLVGCLVTVVVPEAVTITFCTPCAASALETKEDCASCELSVLAAAASAAGICSFTLVEMFGVLALAATAEGSCALAPPNAAAGSELYAVLYLRQASSTI